MADNDALKYFLKFSLLLQILVFSYGIQNFILQEKAMEIHQINCKRLISLLFILIIFYCDHILGQTTETGTTMYYDNDTDTTYYTVDNTTQVTMMINTTAVTQTTSTVTTTKTSNAVLIESFSMKSTIIISSILIAVFMNILP